MIEVYVATSVRNVAAAIEAREVIRGWGHIVHGSWMDFDGGGRSDGELTADERQRLARDCAHEVEWADLVVALWHPAVFGAVIEVGMAIAHHVPVVLVGDWRESVFWSTSRTSVYRVDSLECVKAIAAMRARS